MFEQEPAPSNTMSKEESDQKIHLEYQGVVLRAEKQTLIDNSQHSQEYQQELEEFAEKVMGRKRIANDTNYTESLLSEYKAPEDVKLAHMKSNPQLYTKSGRRIIHKGREALTCDDLPNGWWNTLLELGKKGCTKIQMTLALDVSVSVRNNLIKNDDEFSFLWEKSCMLSEAWWENTGKQNLTNKDFSATLWYMNMKNRFKWRDKAEITLEAKIDNEISIVTKHQLEVKQDEQGEIIDMPNNKFGLEGFVDS
jgi:hypothetical protein